MLNHLRYHWQRLANGSTFAPSGARPRGDFSTEAAKAHSSNFTKGGFFTK